MRKRLSPAQASHPVPVDVLASILESGDVALLFSRARLPVPAPESAQHILEAANSGALEDLVDILVQGVPTDLGIVEPKASLPAGTLSQELTTPHGIEARLHGLEEMLRQVLKSRMEL